MIILSDQVMRVQTEYEEDIGKVAAESTDRNDGLSK